MEWRMRMKKHLVIELTLIISLSVVSFWNVKQQQETVFQKEAIVDLKKENKEYKTKEQQLLLENEHLSDQAKSASTSLEKVQQEYANLGIDTDLNTEFTNVVTKLFEANLNFTPENYEDKKKEVSSYLSEELNKEYFGQKRKTYQNANGTFSKTESIEIYPRGMQNFELESLIVIDYKSKQSGQDWIKGMNIFRVTYDIKIRKFKKIVNLGNGYSR